MLEVVKEALLPRIERPNALDVTALDETAVVLVQLLTGGGQMEHRCPCQVADCGVDELEKVRWEIYHRLVEVSSWSLVLQVYEPVKEGVVFE